MAWWKLNFNESQMEQDDNVILANVVRIFQGTEL